MDSLAERVVSGEIRVLINGFRALPATAGAGGAGKFFEALVTGLASRVRLRVLASEANRESMPVAPGLEYAVVPEETDIAYQAHFNWADIYYDPLNGLNPTLIPPRLPVAVGIMDLQHNVYPRYFTGGLYEARNRVYGFAIGRADGVVTISEFERENIRRVYGVDHVYVVPLSGYTSERGTSDGVVDLASRARSVTGGPYLTYPAIAWRHKNHYRLLEAAGLMRRHASDFRLILTGVEKHALSSNLHVWKLVAERLEETVDVYGHVPQREFAQRLSGARGLVFPSLYEGFGIPVVEAMQMGVPVLTVRETAIPEVAGDAVMYFRDPRNSLAMAEDMLQFWRDEDLRADLARRGRVQGAKFSKARFVDDTLRALTSIRDRHGAGSYEVSGWRKPVHSEVENESPLTVLVLIEARHDTIEAVVESTRAALRAQTFNDTRLCFIVDRSVPQELLSTAFQDSEHYSLADTADSDEVSLAVRFFCESVVDSTYVMYTRSGNLPAVSHEALRVTMRSLDYMEDVGCAVLDPGNEGWAVVPPTMSDQEATDIVESVRPRRMAFFENLVLRSRVLDTAGPIGSLRLLSSLVRSIKYLSGPSR